MHKTDPNFYLTANDAAKDLGISVSSLYAYVSRGLIKSQSFENSRKKGYLRTDIEALKRKKNGFKDDPNFYYSPNIKDNYITKITEAGPLYRGVDALSLARNESAETVASLLWRRDVSLFKKGTSIPAKSKFETIRKNILTLNPLAQYVSLASIIEQESPKSYNLTPDGAARTAVDALRLLPSIILGKEYPIETPLHKFLASKNDLSEGYEELLRAFLVLAADHEQGPAMQIARNSAYAGNTPYNVVSAALIGWQGSYMMKGIGQPLMQFMTDILNTSNPTGAITSRLQEGAPLPGVGSPVYGAKDPRGALLITLTNEYLPDDRDAQKLYKTADMIEDLTGKSPSLAFSAAFLAQKLEMPNQLRALIAAGRCIGWLAHALAVYEDNTHLTLQNS